MDYWILIFVVVSGGLNTLDCVMLPPTDLIVKVLQLHYKGSKLSLVS